MFMQLVTFKVESVNTILSPTLFRFAPSLTVFMACCITHLSIYTYFIKLFCNIPSILSQDELFLRITLAIYILEFYLSSGAS